MSEYTPTTDKVLVYIRGNAVMAGANAEEAQAAAESWLAEVERAAAARALDLAEEDMRLRGYDAAERILRVRAAEIREGK